MRTRTLAAVAALALASPVHAQDSPHVPGWTPPPPVVPTPSSPAAPPPRDEALVVPDDPPPAPDRAIVGRPALGGCLRPDPVPPAPPAPTPQSAGPRWATLRVEVPAPRHRRALAAIGRRLATLDAPRARTIRVQVDWPGPAYGSPQR